MPNNYKLTRQMDQNLNKKQEAFFAKNQAKALKAQKAETETVANEALDFLQVIINYSSSSNDTHEMTPLPQLNSGDKASVSMCGANDDRDIFNAIPSWLAQEITRLSLVRVNL